MARHHTYRPDERPDVEVLVGDTWCPGKLRACTQHDDQSWTADVQYGLPASTARPSAFSRASGSARTPSTEAAAEIT